MIRVSLKRFTYPADEVDQADNKQGGENDHARYAELYKYLRLKDRDGQRRYEEGNGRKNYPLQRHRLAPFLGDHSIYDLVVAVLVHELTPATGVAVRRSENRVTIRCAIKLSV